MEVCGLYRVLPGSGRGRVRRMAVCRGRGPGRWGSIWGIMLGMASSGFGAGERVGFLWVWGWQLGRVALVGLVGGSVYEVFVGRGLRVDWGVGGSCLCGGVLGSCLV